MTACGAISLGGTAEEPCSQRWPSTMQLASPAEGGSPTRSDRSKPFTSSAWKARWPSLIAMPIVSRPTSSSGRNCRILWCLSSDSQGGIVSVMCVQRQGVLEARQASQTSSNFLVSKSPSPLESFRSTSLE